jgi:hypothetical protein
MSGPHSCPPMDRMPDRFTSSADANAMIARTAPAVLELLGDGVARTKKAIVAALAERHAKDDVVCTLMRLAVTGQVANVDRRYSLGPAIGPDQG